MKLHWIAVAVILLFASSLARADQPNFVIILADDLGYGDIGCYGNESTKTPHLDALAAGGLKFSDFHSNGAVCSPTRAALMTGRYQQRSGIGGVVTARGHRDTGLAPEEVTFADILQKSGYATGIFGKWHLGYDPKFNPVKQGFDQFRGYVSGNVDFQSHIDQEGHEDWWHQAELKPEKGYTTYLITEYGKQFIARNKDKPFCLYLPHEAPHYPYQGPNDPAIREAGNPGEIAGGREDVANAYREMVEAMDQGIGEILAALKEHGLEEKTLVFFTSDNGANANGDNGVLRGSKGSPLEGGHRVPAIACWPGTIEPGRTTDVTALTMDLLPTMLDAAGLPFPAEAPKLDGVSLMPILTGKSDSIDDRITFWGTGRGDAVRKGPWKLISPNKANRKKGEMPKLYHLGNDLGESKELSGEEPETVKELQQALEKWQASWAGVPQRS